MHSFVEITTKMLIFKTTLLAQEVCGCVLMPGNKLVKLVSQFSGLNLVPWDSKQKKWHKNSFYDFCGKTLLVSQPAQLQDHYICIQLFLYSLQLQFFFGIIGVSNEICK